MNRKLIWKFNIIDLIIIAIVLLSLFALVYRMISGNGEEKRSYTLTYICEYSPTNLLYEIQNGEACADGDTSTKLGAVTEVSFSDNSEDNRSSAAIRAEVEGYKTDHGITVGETVYLKGMPINLIVGDSVFEVYIGDIE